MIKTAWHKKITEESLQNCLQEALEALKGLDYKYTVEESCIVIIEKGVIKYANDKACRVSKYNEDQLVGKDMGLIYSSSYPENSVDDLQADMFNGKSWHGEIKSIARDGTQYWVDTTIVPVLNGRMSGYTYVAIGTDISKRKSAEELVIVNKELVFQNEEKQKRAAELIIANKELVFQNQEKENRADELIIANKELLFQNKEKEKRAAELLIADKELAFQNVEKGKRAEELIIANKELVFQNVEKENRADELIIANIELVFQNQEKQKRAAELVIADKELAFQNKEKGKRAEELVIANIELVFQNEEKENRASELIIANMELVFQNEEKEKRAAELIIANEELVFQNKEKEKRAAELIIANKELAFQNEEKEKRAAELIIANKELAFQNEEKEKRAGELIIANRELKKAEDDIRKLNEELEQKVLERTAQLESVNKELESFSYSVSHDLRAPLRAVHGYCRMLKEDYGSGMDTEANRIMSNVMNNAKKMGQLIDDLLAFSRLGRKELVKTYMPMKEMVTKLCNEIKIEQEERDLEFRIGDLKKAKGDSVVIKQVWLNLISNAVKYSRLKEKTIIEISSEENVDEISYFIKDNGVGFDMRYSNKLFGMFQRLHTNEKFEGTGVGLAIVHRIISKHGGSVWAEGKVNEGAIFHFSLPKNI